MQNSDSQNQQISVNCRKCGAYNNLAQRKVCWKCNEYLGLPRQPANVAASANSSSPRHIIVKIFSIIAVISILVGVGYTVITSNSKIAEGGAKPVNPTPSDVQSVAALPPNGWYQPSIWNLYREQPTVLEILEKSNQATSKTLKPSDVQNLSLSGTVSFAFDGCVTAACRQKEEDLGEQERLRKEVERKRNAYGNYDPQEAIRNSQEAWRRMKEEAEAPKVVPGPVTEFSHLRFERLGEIAVYQKGKDKIFRKIKVRPKNSSKRVDIIERFNGVTGWKEETVYEEGKPDVVSVKDLTGTDLESLKDSATGLEKNLSEKNLSFSHLTMVNEKVNFVLKNNDPDKPKTLYFDAVTGFLSKLETGEMTAYAFPYSEFKGVNLPSTMYFRTVNEDGKIMWMKIDEINWGLNEEIEDSIFEKKAN